MKLFECTHCHNPVFFENVVCEQCGHTLGFEPGSTSMLALQQSSDTWIPDSSNTQSNQAFRFCANFRNGVCNWLLPADSDDILCCACKLNSTIPSLDLQDRLNAWGELEKAKHRVIYSILQFGLPLISKDENPEFGLAFNFLSNELQSIDQPPIQTGHMNGLITINLAEADSVHREKMRVRLDEPYRTLIGHFRHEIGHYYWDLCIKQNDTELTNFRQIFGDEQLDYQQALQAHYQNKAPANWQEHYVSEYAASHPWEDWAETWAHYFHLVDCLETAHGFGLQLQPNVLKNFSLSMDADFNPYHQDDFEKILQACVPLTFAINSINRSMGLPDLYPFVLSTTVKNKLNFIHEAVSSVCAS